MNKLYRCLGILTFAPLFITACVTYAAQAKSEKEIASRMAPYRAMLGKSLSDTNVQNFLVSNGCSKIDTFFLCKDAGMALRTSARTAVEAVYLYLNNEDGFAAYQGVLPFDLRYYDTMGAVEYKLKRQGIGKDGLPDVGKAPDHLHYWAVYKQAGMTIIYNSPFADEDATINAILVSK